MNKLLVKAAQQVLAEVLGYDEAKTYYLLLIRKEEELEKEFSYSKRYRLMKSLFELGVMGKIKQEDHDFFSYIILPPSFLYFRNVDLEIINFLERLYLYNSSQIMNINFSQFILKDVRGLLIFLLKYFMKEQAKLDIDELRIKDILKEKSERIKLLNNREKRKLGVIDRKLVFDFVSVMNKNGYEYVGYIAKKDKDYIDIVENEMERLSKPSQFQF